MTPKYELTDETIQFDGKPLYRIRALRDFHDPPPLASAAHPGSLSAPCDGPPFGPSCVHRDVKAGDLGGFVESEANLSQCGEAWVSGDAKVSDDARVFGNAWVSGDAGVFGKAWVFGNARVSGKARVFDNDTVYEAPTS